MFSENTDRRELERRMRDAGRLPPGQSATVKWPVLHVGRVPRGDPFCEGRFGNSWGRPARLPVRS